MRGKKRTAGITAGILAASILLTGTFAWRSISQQAKNEVIYSVNPGGRLHDDFNGENKDVYVENFMTAGEGGQPIFARIRLDEYMEVGSDAGVNRDSVTRDATPLAKSAKDPSKPANINDVTTWATHIPDTGVGNCKDHIGTPAADAATWFHNSWEWTMGGEKVFMPTFNKNKDSLSADINGTWEGVTADDEVHFDDYNTYTTVKEDEDPDQRLFQSMKANAYYDVDGDTADEYFEPHTAGHNGGPNGDGGDPDTDYRATEETHTAKSTLNATVMTMADWIAAGSPIGPYWVYDIDGWAYWAQAIEPGEATGLLLDGIKYADGEAEEGGEPVYYAINVVGQFATAGEWGSTDNPVGFYDPSKGAEPTNEALFLLKQAAGLEYKVEVTGPDGVIDGTTPVTLAPGDTMDFSVNVSVGTTPTSQGKDVTWTLRGGTKAGTKLTKLEPRSFSTLSARATVIYGAQLTIDSEEPVGTKLTVCAETVTGVKREFKVQVGASGTDATPTPTPTETPAVPETPTTPAETTVPEETPATTPTPEPVTPTEEETTGENADPPAGGTTDTPPSTPAKEEVPEAPASTEGTEEPAPVPAAVPAAVPAEA